MGKGLFAFVAAALLAIAVGVPTLAGGESIAEKSAKVKRIAKKALKTAKAAQAAAASAQGSADTALERTARLSFVVPNGTAEEQVLSVAGLRVFAECVGGNVLEARVDTTVSSSIIHIASQRNATPIDFQDDTFNVGEEAPLAGDAGDDDNVAGELTYRNGSTGQVVTMTYLMEESYLGANDCAVLGTATVV
jgi:hypothetical protein